MLLRKIGSVISVGFVGEASSPPWTRTGMTLVELMVTVLIGAILATTLGVFFVKLLTIQEQEREEGYVREKLVDICAAYADYLSIASSVSNNAAAGDMAFSALYRQETGGVSLETGRVSRVTHFFSSLDAQDSTLGVSIGHYVTNDFQSGFSRTLRGDALLMNLTNDLVAVGGAMVTPLNATLIENASLVYLKVSARCECKNEKGEKKYKYVTAGRIVRLWNKE